MQRRVYLIIVLTSRLLIPFIFLNLCSYRIRHLNLQHSQISKIVFVLSKRAHISHTCCRNSHVQCAFSFPDCVRILFLSTDRPGPPCTKVAGPQQLVRTSHFCGAEVRPCADHGGRVAAAAARHAHESSSRRRRPVTRPAAPATAALRCSTATRPRQPPPPPCQVRPPSRVGPVSALSTPPPAPPLSASCRLYPARADCARAAAAAAWLNGRISALARATKDDRPRDIATPYT